MDEYLSYRTYLLSRHPKVWYGKFVETTTCPVCLKDITQSLNLQVHHLQYLPPITCFVHAGCHSYAYCADKEKREQFLKLVKAYRYQGDYTGLPTKDKV
jgi:hypothetical protein